MQGQTTKMPRTIPGLLALGLIGVALAAASGIVWLQSYTANQYRRSTEVATLIGDSLLVNGFSFWVYAANTPDGGGLPPDVTREYVEEMYAKQVADFKITSVSAPPENKAALAEFLAATEAGVALAHEGRLAESFGKLNESSNHIVNYSPQLTASAERFTRNAEQARLYSSIAAVSLVLAALALVGAFFWRYMRTQKRVLEAETEHEVLRRSEAHFRPLVEHSVDVIGISDANMHVTYISPAAERLSGIPPSAIVGSYTPDTIHPDDVAKFISFIDEVKSRPGYTARGEFRFVFPTGERILETVCTNQLEDPDIAGLVFNEHDVTERTALEEQLRHQAFHDSLTDLANRLLFTERLEHALLRNRMDAKHQPISVVYLDLDHFKDINDELGHSMGDEFLKILAQRIYGCIRPADTAARLGGDEFAVLLENASTIEEARAVADRLLVELSGPVMLSGNEISLTASIGVVLADPMTMTAEEVVRNADIAMYDAKADGRACVRVYESNARSVIIERIHMSNELHAAVAKKEFRIMYQPTMDLGSGRTTGFEALVRWQHPTLGFLEPLQFITLAEDTGVIITLGEFVLREACRQGKEWQDRYDNLGLLTMSVNVSTKQIQRSGFVEMVKQILSETKFEPSLLILELTESVLVANPEQAIGVMNELKSLGVQIALDDFGTGYSSLSYLKRFPIDILKIDRSFIDGLDKGDKERMLVQTVIDLGNMLNLEIVAEGIERQEQLSRLRNLNCGFGQGYLFARPLDLESADQLLARLEEDNRPHLEALQVVEPAVKGDTKDGLKGAA